ncbi:hypothetical protein ABZ366_21805, partial [Streptomyces sp. NPDC005904]|uniref:hypothetical protein n=1 Tax=Streptomyces sp. NPDC005904 TaxID=3154570 RepID=UPI00340B3BED
MPCRGPHGVPRRRTGLGAGSTAGECCLLTGGLHRGAPHPGGSVTAAGQPAPATYTKGEHDYENLCRR